MNENNSQLNSKGNLKNLRTYQTDMADTVRTNEISVIKVALAEKNKREKEDTYQKIEGTPTKKIFWFIGGLIIISGAIYGFYYFNNLKIENNTPIKIVKEESIISYDEIYSISVNSSDNLIDKILIAKNLEKEINKSGYIKYLLIEEVINNISEKLSINEIFSKLKFTAPSSLIRSLSSDLYMIGTYTNNLNGTIETQNGNPNLFLIFKSNDYEFTYAGMLQWEKTLALDVYDLFKLDASFNNINEKSWRDIIINNKDARVLFNENNKPILYYLFVDKENLVIADNSDTLKEIILRLNIKKIKPL